MSGGYAVQMAKKPGHDRQVEHKRILANANPSKPCNTLCLNSGSVQTQTELYRVNATVAGLHVDMRQL